MTSFTLYPHSYSIIPSIHHQNIHRIHLNNSYHHHYLIYLVSRSTHLGTRSPLYLLLYSTSFISMTSFTLYPHSYSIIPSIHHQNIHRIHQNNSYHHHYLIYLVSRSTHLGTRSPLYIILYSTSFISMTSFTLYPHSYSIIPSTKHSPHHQNIHRIHLGTRITRIITIYNHTHLSIHHQNMFHLNKIKIYTSWNKISTLYHTLFNIIHFNDIIPSIIHTHTVSFHPFITKTFTAFTRITRIITIISFILFQDLHIGTRSPLYIYFIQHHSFQWHHSTLYPHSYSSFHSFINKTFTAFTRITRIITIISFILFQDLHILEQDLHSISYFIQHHSFQWHHSSISTLIQCHSIIHHQNIHRIHQNNSYHHHYLIYLVSRSTHLGTRLSTLYHTLFNIIHFNDIIPLYPTHTVSFHPFITKTFTAFTWITLSSPLSHLSCFKIYTSWNKISTLYHTLFNIIHFNDIIHSISTLIQYHSIHLSPKHSPHSPE